MSERDENLLPLVPVKRADQVREAVPLVLHRRVHAELVARNNEGFIEGICHTIDELHAAGFVEAAEAMLARLFKRPSGEGSR